MLYYDWTISQHQCTIKYDLEQAGAIGMANIFFAHTLEKFADALHGATL